MTIDKALLKTAGLNGLIFTGLLIGLSYFKNGYVNWYYVPLWFVFFAGTGALRYRYKKSKGSNN